MPKKNPEILNKAEIDSIINASMDDDFCYTLFTLAKYTGRRLGEYYNVRVKDIDFDKKIMMTLILKRRKHVEKEALLTDDCVRLLRQYITKQHLKLEDYVFRAVSYRQIQNLIKKYSIKAVIKKNVSFHNFRHYFITALVKENWSYDKIAKLTGHTSIATLSRYDSAVASDIRKDAEISLANI